MNNISTRNENTRKIANQGPFSPDWYSLQKYECPEWFKNAKFGVYVCWGPYSVPAYQSEWYCRHMYEQEHPTHAHHVETYGPVDQFGYKDFIPMFKAEKYDPEAWANLVERSGARYAVQVADFSDGFAMFESDITKWNTTKMGPKRDVMGEFSAAVRKRGIHFGASSHYAEHCWFYGEGKKIPSDVQDPQFSDLYGPALPIPAPYRSRTAPPPSEDFLEKWLARTGELADKYDLDLMWLDFGIENLGFQPYLQEFASYFYNLSQTKNIPCVLNYKDENFVDGTATLDLERGQLDEIRTEYWQTDTAIDLMAWGYIDKGPEISTGTKYRSASSLIHDLIDIVSKNGNLLLCIGPKADGTIPEEQSKTLLEIGEWLSTNGEAIYDTRPWSTFGEGPTEVPVGPFSDTKRESFTCNDIRFTTKGEFLFAFALGLPEQNNITIKTLGNKSPKRIELLGVGEVKFKVNETELTITLPEIRNTTHALTFKILGVL